MRTFRTITTGIATLALLASTTLAVSAQSPSPAGVDPVWVTGTVIPAATCTDVVTDARDNVTRQGDYRCETQTWTSTDPRFGGRAIAALSENVYQAADGSIYSVFVSAADIRGETGGWHCSSHVGSVAGKSGLMSVAFEPDQRVTCTGDGDNLGLSAVLTADWAAAGYPTFEGLIFPGDLPPLPETSSTP